MGLADDISSAATLDDGTHLIEAFGEIDSVTAPALQRALLSGLAEGHERVVLDLSGVSFMDSSGIGAVMAAYAEAKDRTAVFAVVSGDSHASHRFRIMGLDTILRLFPSRDAALAGVRAG